MRRLFPAPFLSVGLALMWLLLKQSVALADVLWGSLLGVVLAWWAARLEPSALALRRPGAVVRLLGSVLVDITRSNIAVAKVILHPHRRAGEPGFVHIPLALRDRTGLAALACIITATPGTLWVAYDSGTRALTIHVLDLIEADAWVRTIQQRYERPLREIFE